MYALSLACEVRIRWYLNASKQCDNIDSMQALLKLVGKQSILSYFQIAYALQCDIFKRLNLKGTHLYSSLNLVNVGLGIFFKDEQLLNKLLHFQKQADPS